MAENRPRFPIFLHLAIGQVSAIFVCFGILGYMIYGNNVPQIITDVLPPGPLSFTIWSTILIAVLFTYPLQFFPVIQIVEGFLFDERSRGKGKFQELLESNETDQLLINNGSRHCYDAVDNSSTVASARFLSTSLFPASINDTESKKEELLSDTSSTDNLAPVYVETGCKCLCKVRKI